MPVGSAPRATPAVDGFLFRGFSADSLGLFRIVFCLGLIPFHVGQFERLLDLDPQGAGFFYLRTMWHFDLLGVDHHVPALAIGVFWLLLMSSTTAAAGFYTRTSLFLVLACILFLKGARDGLSGEMHHRYYIPFHFLAILLVSHSGDVWSVDAWRRKSETVVASWQASWPLRTMQLYCSSFYFLSALAKLRVSGWAWFADGARVQELLLQRGIAAGAADEAGFSGAHVAVIIAEYPALCLLLALSTLVFELSFMALPWIRSAGLRLAFLAGVTFFHVANYWLVGVKFQFLPVVFLAFFDLARIPAGITGARRFIRREGFAPL